MSNLPVSPLRSSTMFISTACGSGAISRAQGSFASFTCLALWWLLYLLGLWSSFETKGLAIALISTIGVIAVSRLLTQHPGIEEDPGFVVIDEWAGMLIALYFVTEPSPVSLLLAFALFRLFDILKPGPVRWAEAIPGAWGIMADDLLAGLLAASVYYFARGFLPA